MMTNGKDEVIDLTESFTLANHSALDNVVIELDDSFYPGVYVERDFNSEADEPLVAICNGTVPTQSSASNRLNRTKKPKKKVQSGEQRDETIDVSNIRERSPVYVGSCAICFETIGTNPLASTKCGHVFCLLCLEQALHVNKKCPSCRRALHGKNAYHPLFLSRS